MSVSFLKQGKFIPVLLLSFILGFSNILQAQSRDELKTLFFDGVILDNPEEILLSSAARTPGLTNLTPLTNAPTSGSGERSLSDLLDDISEYEASINTLIEQGGTFDPRLAQAYLSISDLYRQAGDFENATLALENTMHIERVNQGLYTLGQTEAVRQLIEYNKAGKNYAEADKYHEYLFYIMSRNLDDKNKEYTDAVLEWADWNLQAYRRLAFYDEDALAMSGSMSSIGSSMLRNGELVAIEDNQFNDLIFVPRSLFLANSSSLRSQSFTPEQLVDPRLKKAEELFDRALESENLDEADNEVILYKKAELVHLFKLQIGKFISNSAIGSNITRPSTRGLRSVPFIRRGYADSREELLARATKLEENEPEKAALAHIDLADWDLAFDRLQRATQGYQKAESILLENGYTAEDASKIITPEPALFIPQFVSFEDTRKFQNIPENLDIPYLGYIDVSFNKRATGTLRNVRIINTSENTGHLVRNRLLDLLRSTTIRPDFESGKRVAQSDIYMRYYYSY